jgi:predicted RNA-binding protein associated with RNAse of E/G family
LPAITVLKLDPQGRETWRYHAQVIQSLPDRVVLEAHFDREDRQFHGMPLRRGDRFLETYFTDRWYNIYEIHAREDDTLRGWYCNVGKPALLDGDCLSYVDLALDLLVFPDGRQVVLDEDEFISQDLSAADRLQALAALEELKRIFSNVSAG